MADGRVMVDIHTFNRMNPSYTEFGSSAHDTATQQQVNQLLANQQRLTGNYSQTALNLEGQKKLNPSQLFMTWPYVAGFSFSAKRWGELLVENLTNIQFDDKAYDRLVIPEDKKMLIRALVEDNKRIQHVDNSLKSSSSASKTSSDVISGKGGGVIFLLHGSPGVGKTLTAEAIAELLHYPLYR